MLRLLRRRYLQGSENLKGDGIFNLPLSDYKGLVNKSNGETSILEEKSGRALLLVCASSGLWSIVPSTLVTSYLAAQSELERSMTSGISKSVSNETLAEITTVVNKYTNSFFLNVVEEPAQNLFPESQMKNLAFLLEAANVNDENKIVMTTHSPCVLSYITLAAKAYELMNKGVKCDFITQKQNERQ